jgi:hypothetical protein
LLNAEAVACAMKFTPSARGYIVYATVIRRMAQPRKIGGIVVLTSPPAPFQG